LSLPSLVTPEYTIQIPSTKQKINFRPFLVKEEKILLTAMEAGESEDITKAIKNVMRNCILSDVDIDKLSFFDFEYIFLMLRSKSVGNTLDLTFLHDCKEPKVENRVIVDLDSIQVTFPKEHTDKIMIDDTYGVKMKYPTLGDTDSYQNLNTINILNILSNFIEFVYDDKNVYDEFTEEEMNAFIESMNKNQLEKIIEFFQTMPSLQHTVKYECKNCKEKVSHEVKGLTSFFT
jgi:hypothetical protein